MILIVIGLCCLIIAIILFILSSKKHHINNEIDERNKELKNLLDTKYEELDVLTNEIESIEKAKKGKSQELDDLIQKYSSISKQQEEMMNDALKSYSDNLEYRYKEQENEYNKKVEALYNSYEEKSIELNTEFKINLDELEKIKSTLRAVQEAEIRKKEVEDNSAFYSITIDETDLADIKVLNSIKSKLQKPRILSMLIWQTYWQKPLKTLSANVLGKETKCGVYKITNIITNECYIGQAVKYRPMKNFSC